MSIMRHLQCIVYFGLHDNCLKKDEIMSIKKVELLAPAGDFACFRAAVNAGADAVYLAGGQYGARAYASLFFVFFKLCLKANDLFGIFI